MKKRIFAFALILSFVLCVPAQINSFVIRNATIIDGSGKAGFLGDIRVRGDKIIAIGKVRVVPGEESIDATGLILAPGFIDIHNHSESGLFREGTAANQVSQGITTVMVGPDGGSPLPVSEYFQKLNGKVAVNVGSFMGHASVREEVLQKDFKRTATAEEISAMAKLVDRGMKDGAFGLSSGLEYDVGFMATTEELIELGRVAAKSKSIYFSHIRYEGEGI